MNSKKKTELIKYAALGLLTLAFYYRAELFNIVHPPDPAIAMLQSGARAYQSGNYKQALAVSEMILNRFPDSDRTRHAHLLRGMSMQKLGDDQAATTDLHFVTEHYPGTVEARVATEALRQLGASATVKQTGQRHALPTDPLQAPPASGDPPPSPPDTNALVNVHAPGNFVGKWQSQPTTLLKQGICILTVEIRAQEQGFSAYPLVSCRPLVTQQLIAQYRGDPAQLVQKMIMQGNPSSAVLSGAWDKDYKSLVFKVDTVTSTNESNCGFTGDIKVTPFGGSQLAVDWKDACDELAQFLLNRQANVRGQQ